MRIHFIAIGGSIMHSLALVMQARGHDVTGSDDEIYEPSRSRLAAKGLLPAESGWHEDRITSDIDLVVLGMHARGDNPELLKAQSLGLRISSFPEFIYQLSADKTRIVVAGSHGKTTTSGMLAHVFHAAGMNADRMIGAKIGDLEPVAITDAGLIVLEGDEYLSSPLDPRPKFLHYQPHVTIITGIAWDHMNVFPTYDAYVNQFELLIESLDNKAVLIYCADDQDLVDLVDRMRPACQCIPYHAHPYTLRDDVVFIRDREGQEHPLQIFGHHNLQNLMAALLTSKAVGMDEKAFYTAIESFTGASKRLQILHRSNEVTAYLDFAHAPSKVRATVNAVREKHPGARLIACLELHTFSSLNPAFLPYYRDTLAEADVRIVYYSPHTLMIKKLPELSSALLADFFHAPDVQVATTAADLEQFVRTAVIPGEIVLLWMSSGRFDDLDIRGISESIHA